MHLEKVNKYFKDCLGVRDDRDSEFALLILRFTNVSLLRL